MLVRGKAAEVLVSAAGGGCGACAQATEPGTPEMITLRIRATINMGALLAEICCSSTRKKLDLPVPVKAGFSLYRG
jgi:hypothetical protein